MYIYIYILIYLYIFIYTHFSQAGDISRCFPSCLLSRKVHAACSFRRCFDKSWIWKMKHQSWLWGFDVGPVELFPSRSRATRWIVFLVEFLDGNCEERCFERSHDHLSGKLCLFLYVLWFLFGFFLKLEYVSVDGFFLNIPWEAQFQGFGDAPLKLPWENKTKPGNSIVWYIDSWSNYSDLTRPGPQKNVAEAGKSLEFVQGNLGWWNIKIWQGRCTLFNNLPKKLNFRTNPVSPVGFKDVFSFTSKLRQILSTSLECKFTSENEGIQEIGPKNLASIFQAVYSNCFMGKLCNADSLSGSQFWKNPCGVPWKWKMFYRETSNKSNKHPSNLYNMFLRFPNFIYRGCMTWAWHVRRNMYKSTRIASQNFRKYHPWAQHLARSTHNGLWWTLHRMP